MRYHERDLFGSAGDTTEYERGGKAGGKAGSSKTKMAVGITVVTLALFFTWLFTTPYDADPAPEGPAYSISPEAKAP